MIASPYTSNINYDNKNHQVVGERRCELSNHLGNVLQVLTDRKLAVDDGIGGVDYYVADVVGQSDYYPFGMMLPNRNEDAGAEFRYAFNGMEKDDEVTNQNATSYTSYFRQYDPRIGRWLSLDPAIIKYPDISPCAAFKNNPIFFSDPHGDDVLPPILKRTNPKLELLDPEAVRRSLEMGEGKYHIQLGSRINQMGKIAPNGSDIYSYGVGENTRYFKAYFTPDLFEKEKMREGDGGVEYYDEEYIDKADGWITLVELSPGLQNDFARGGAAQAAGENGERLPVSQLTTAHIELGIAYVGSFLDEGVSKVQQDVMRGAKANGEFADPNSFNITKIDIVINANAPQDYKDALRESLIEKYGGKVEFTESDLMRDTDLFDWDINFEYNLLSPDADVDTLDE